MSYMSYSYNEYAKLGNGCQANTNVLVSNAKFIPINSPLYSVFPTPGYILYPGENTNHLPLVKNTGELETKYKNCKSCKMV